MKIKTVTVIGANGMMGQYISGIFASFGGAKVYMVARNIEKAEVARIGAAVSVKATSILSRLEARDYSTLEACVAESDIVFESVAEDIDIKKKIVTIVAKTLRKDAIACTGTSGLSVTELAEQYPERLRGQFFGIHMFNPPYHMRLCELITTSYVNKDLSHKLIEYLSKSLLREVVVVQDSAGFLANRIGFQFMNEALQYAEQYEHSGGVDYIDAILGGFSGRSLAPLATVDFVGLDIHKAIVDNIYSQTEDYAHDSFFLPEYVQDLICEGKLGRKTGAGLYKTVTLDNGTKKHLVYDIRTKMYRETMQYTFPFAETMRERLRIGDYENAFRCLINNKSPEAKLCLSFLLKYVLYALETAKAVGDDIHAADHVMATGFNWCPPLAIIDALSKVSDVKSLMVECLEPSIFSVIDLDDLFEKIEPSSYDYRPYFKAKR